MSYCVSKIGHLDPHFYSLIYCAIPMVQMSVVQTPDVGVQMSGVQMSGVQMSGVHMSNFPRFVFASSCLLLRGNFKVI